MPVFFSAQAEATLRALDANDRAFLENRLGQEVADLGPGRVRAVVIGRFVAVLSGDGASGLVVDYLRDTRRPDPES